MSTTFLADPPRFLFFTGKGGVGKTSLACATALQLAERGSQVLLVSTDPASNIGQVFDLQIGDHITAVPSVPGLSALEIDPEQAAAAYRERIVGPVRGLLPERELASITEQLSGSCTTEIASFDEFTGLLTDQALARRFDHILFDTAPTGHTIRLLQLPASWTEYLTAGKGDASCLGPLSGLDRQRATYAAAVAALTDPTLTRMVLVARPQSSALAEVARTAAELRAIGIDSGQVVLNGVLPARAGDEPLATAIRQREEAAMAAMPNALAQVPTDVVSLKATNMVGVPALRSLLDEDAAEPVGAPGPESLPPAPTVATTGAPLRALVDAIEQDGHGLVLCMGKGGVGKTTIAAAIAVALAERGHQALLTTTDPAAHVVETLAGSVDQLEVSRIDPVEATQRYREQVLATKGKGLDDAGRAVLAEDLRSPCTEEVAVFQQFSKVVHESRQRFVIVDTAPTGHTLLLLDAAGAYHREVARQLGEAGNYTTPLMRLQDPSQTKVVLVTLAEPTPVAEAEELQADLLRAGIQPWAWVVNNSLAAAGPTSAFLRQRAQNERGPIARVVGQSNLVAVVPLLAREPVGEAALSALTR
ncbi:MAG: arsenite/tail-anchored protein-transporting ATPase [Actinomycetota bacterium]|nr:arsenite/tail-anchored protein-transporting ATPase [Actinomycetota bacterium]